MIRQLINCLVLALLAGAVHAADPPVVSLPDPANLSSDWWGYFEPAEPIDAELLDERVTAAKKSYAKLEQYLRDTGDTENVQQIGRIIDHLSRFAELKNRPAQLLAPIVAEPNVYTLDVALQQFDEWLKLDQKLTAEIEETAWLEAVLVERRKKQSRLRSQYLAIEKRAPDKLGRGLELIVKRLQIESQRVELDWRNALQKDTKEGLTRRRAALDLVPEKLEAGPEDLKTWQEKYADAQQAIAKQRELLDRPNLEKGQPGAVNPLLQQPQYATLATVHAEIEIGINELLASRALQAQSLIRYAIDQVELDGEQIRAQLGDSESLQTLITAQSKRWQQLIVRLRGLRPESNSDAAGNLEPQQELAQIEHLLRKLSRESAINNYLSQMLSTQLHATESWWQGNFADFTDNVIKVGTTGKELLVATMFEINETPVTALGVLRVVFIITIALWLSRFLRRTITTIGERRDGLSKSSLYTFGRLLHYFILTIGIIIGLSSIGIDFTKFALFASALGVGIGFGLQTLISNFVAGLIILFEKSLKVGDFVELESGVNGEVMEINMRSTLITTNDNVDILVPNSEFVGGRVINWTMREAHRRVRVPFGVAYGTDKDQVKKAILEAAANVSWTLQKEVRGEPQVWLVEFGDSSLNFELVVWLTPEAVKRPGSVHAAYLWEIDSKLREYNIEIPFPQRDLHLRSGFGVQETQSSPVSLPDDGVGDKTV